MTNLTKAQIKKVLTEAKIEFPAKANLATLTALLPVAPAEVIPPAEVAPASTGLKIQKDRITQNGITQPSIGGKCRAVWDALSAYQAETGELPTAKVVGDLAADEGWNPNNASIEFYQWRKFNGITGRQPKKVAPAETVAPAEAVATS